MKVFLLFVISFVLVIQTQAQREQGSWQDYLSYSNALDVTVGDNMVFCVSEGGLFYVDQQDNSINKYTQLSDFGIKCISYNAENEVLVVAYKNSNIDLVYGDRVVNLSDIKRKIITADKTIYNISFNDNEAFLSCGFGIVVINLDKQEIKDTYYIGDDGSTLVVKDVDVYSGFIYAATAEGVLKAPESGVNLADYNNWILDENIPNQGKEFSDLALHSGGLIANYSPGTANNDELYIYDGFDWSPFYSQSNIVLSLKAVEGYLLLTSKNEVVVFDGSNSMLGRINSYQFDGESVGSISPKSASVSADGSIWIADYKSALVKYNGELFESLLPNGPADNDVFSLNHTGSALWVAPGSMIGFQEPRFQRFSGGEWTYFNRNSNEELTGFHNILDIEVDPKDENHFFVASWGGGLLEYRNDELVERYNNLNSPLESALPQQPNEPYTRIGGMAFDAEGNIWVTNSECAHNLHKLSADGEWVSFELPKVKNKYNLSDVIVTEDGDKWMLVLSGHDAYVVDKTGTQIKQLLVTSYFSNGNETFTTRMNDVYSIAKDLDGAIWIGTSKGVIVYNSPSRFWTSDAYYGSQPGLDLNDGIYHPLLETETVTAIAVDGANRKWFGTKASGVFLISETGEKEILHFTAENSALLSNSILSITINQKNGEVFFGTDKGLISYQGEATGGNQNYSNVYVYPNPVRETYDGPVTIAGLIENTDIKITDISGNLVFKTTSLGGQAVWDGTNLNGNRVKTGVYLVFCNDSNGEETHITKLLFIN